MARGTLDARFEQRYDRRGNPAGTYLAHALAFEELSQNGVDESHDHDERYQGMSIRPAEHVLRDARR